jgi:hypothetical protein
VYVLCLLFLVYYIWFDLTLTLAQFFKYCVVWFSGKEEKSGRKGQVLRLCWHTYACCVAWLPQERSLSPKPTRSSGKCPTAASASERLPGLRMTATVAVASPPHLFCLASCSMLGHGWDAGDSSSPCHKLSLRPQSTCYPSIIPQVRTNRSYNPWRPESRSTCMFPSLWVEMDTMHGEVHRGGLPCVTNKHIYYFVAFLCASNGSLMLLVSFSTG